MAVSVYHTRAGRFFSGMLKNHASLKKVEVQAKVEKESLRSSLNLDLDLDLSLSQKLRPC
jgi:hypothetical protein